MPTGFHFFLSKVLMLSQGQLQRGSSKCVFLLAVVLASLGGSWYFIMEISHWSIFDSWASYKINQTQDKIGVFVSIVSTKIPFKGTGKEYIGDDISEIASAVKVSLFYFLVEVLNKLSSVSKLRVLSLQSAIQQCCIQLKSKIMKRIQAREQQERKRNMSKLITLSSSLRKSFSF